MLKLLLRVSIVIAFGISALIPADAGAQTPAFTQKSAAKANAQLLARAKEVYSVDCAVCHGVNGNGKTDLAASMQLVLSDWTDPKSLAGKSDADLFKIIRDGKGQMPSEPTGRASDSAVQGLIQYIRSMAQPQPGAGKGAGK